MCDYCSVCVMALNDICHRLSPSGSQLFSRCESVRRAVGTRGSGFPSLHMKVNAFKALHVSVIVVWLGRRFCSVMNSYSCAQQRPAEEKSSGKIKLQHVLDNAYICHIYFTFTIDLDNLSYITMLTWRNMIKHLFHVHLFLFFIVHFSDFTLTFC